MFIVGRSMEDEFDVEVWVNNQDCDALCAISALTAARVLPFGYFTGRSIKSEQDGSLDEDLRHLRCLITVFAAVQNDTALLRTPALGARQRLKRESYSTLAAKRAVSLVTAGNHEVRKKNALDAINAAMRSAVNYDYGQEESALIALGDEVGENLIIDIKAIENVGLSTFGEMPLWSRNLMPTLAIEAWDKLRADWEKDPAMQFWADWYEGLLKGKPPDWELWKRIALIDGDTWQVGAHAVAFEVKKLYTASILRDAILGLEQELVRIARLPVYESNLHNGGDPLDDILRDSAQVELIREKLAILKEELEKFDEPGETPDSSILMSTAKFLLDVMKPIVSYVARKSDIAVDALIKNKVTALAAGVTVTVAADPSKLERVARAAIDLAKLLGAP